MGYFADIPGMNRLTPEEEKMVLNGTWQGRNADGSAKGGVQFKAGDVCADGLRRVIKSDITGRQIAEYEGEPSMWMDQFKGLMHLQVRINNQPKSPFYAKG